MKFRNLIILSIVFIVLIGVVFVKKSMEPIVPTTEEMTDLIAPSLNPEDIREAVFRFGTIQTNVHLAQEEGTWKVKSLYGVYADETVLKAFLKKMDDLRGELRSDDAALLGDYGITDEEGIHILLNGESGSSVHLVVGSKRAGRSANFVRLQGRNEVYVTDDDLLSEFGLWGEPLAENFDADKWADKQILRFDPKDVIAYRILEGRGSDEKVWLDVEMRTMDDKKKWESPLPYAFGLSAAKIKDHLQNFLNMRASKVVAADAFDASGDSFWKIEWKLENGRQITLVRGNKEKDGYNYYVKTAEGHCFLVPVSTWDHFVGGSGDIFISNPLEIKDEAVTGIEIQDVIAGKKFAVNKTTTLKMEKPAGEDKNKEGREEIVWKTSAGEDMENVKTTDILQKFKNMNLFLAFTEGNPAGNALVVKINEGEKNNTYAIAESKTMADGRGCHILRVGDDSHSYCYMKSDMDNFKSAVPFRE